MIETVDSKLLAMPTDDELYSAFFDAAMEGAHENIKGIVKTIGKYSGAAKGEVKKMINFDPNSGLSLHFDLQTGNEIMKGFVDAQPLLIRPTVKVLMTTYHAATFTDFVEKMKKTQDNIDVCNATLPNILILFLQKLAAKYVVNETQEHVREMIHAIFG